MLGLDHDRNAARLEDLLDRGRNLRGHVLLRLQPTRIDVHQAGELGKAHDPVDRLIGDMRQGLTTASIAVSPFDRPEAGGVTGAAASVIRAWEDSTHARRPDAAFPFYMACVWLCAAKGRSRPAGACSRLPAAPYIFVQKGRAIAAPCYHRPRSSC